MRLGGSWPAGAVELKLQRSGWQQIKFDIQHLSPAKRGSWCSNVLESQLHHPANIAGGGVSLRQSCIIIDY